MLMADYYADSSALVKRHIPEIGSAWFQALADRVAGNTITTARVSMAEVYSALNRRIREATLDTVDYARLVTDFNALCVTQYTLIELTAPIGRARTTALGASSLARLRCRASGHGADRKRYACCGRPARPHSLERR